MLNLFSRKEAFIPQPVEAVLAQICDAAVIPVIRVPAREHALCAVEGIVAGGLPVVEITLTVPGALAVIEDLHIRFGDRLLIGAGTVLDEENCRSAIRAGAWFIVSPVFDPRVLEAAKRAETMFIPGALTPNEISMAWRSGADAVKIFPCGAMGGPAYIRTLRGPFPDIPLVITGGVTCSNTAEYLAAGALAVGAGESILPRAALEAKDSAAVANHTRSYVEVVRSYRAQQSRADLPQAQKEALFR